MNLFTIIAQLINFSVLIYLLNKFLYKPVLATLEKRREDIKSKMEEIEYKLKESDKLKEEYLSKLKNLEKENAILKEKAIQEANEIKELELQKARQDLSEKKDRFNEYLNLEQQKLVENFNENLGELFINYSNNIFKSIANTDLDNQIINKIIENINNLNNDKIEEINKLNPDFIEIITSFEVNKEQQTLLVDFYNIGQVLVKGESLKSIELAYAISCHSAQGSGFPYLIYCVDYTHFSLLTRQQVYTGITRAKKRATFIFETRALNRAIRTNHIVHKRTFLYSFLTNEINSNNVEIICG